MINYVVVLYHSHSLCDGGSLTCIVCRNWKSNSSLLGPIPQLALPVEFLFEILCVGAHPQLTLPVEFLFEILCVGAHPQLAHYCKLTFRQLLCWGPGL
ncbi:hypothetical protein B4O96_05350 [Staphylococcus aureus]|nr:hypothetical protein [Escherichia coli]RBL76289.1 hypothetical protein B4O96_05350 [Staphylococcus aureus]RBL76504.1 hypothetical protein B7472_07820 [Staphylococcus aureus]